MRSTRSHGLRSRGPHATVAALAAVAVLATTGDPAMTQSKSPDTPVSSRDAGARGSSRLSEGISGRVVSAKGAAVAGLMVEVTADGPASGPIPDIAVMTGADGRFEWRLSAGNYRVRLLREGRWSRAKAVRVMAGRAVEAMFDDGDW